METAFRLAAIAALTALFMAWIARRVRGGGGAVGDAEAGTIAPEKISAALTVLGGLALLLAGIWLTVAGQGYGPLLLSVIGAAIAGFMLPSLTPLHDLTWDPDGVEGPARMFGPTLGIERTTIAWQDVARAGATVTGYWFLEAADGRRVYWSFLYKGNGAFAAAIRARCPGVTVPAR